MKYIEFSEAFMKGFIQEFHRVDKRGLYASSYGASEAKAGALSFFYTYACGNEL